MGLKLSRKTGQSLLIGDNIKVTFDRLKNGQAWIEVHAPKEVSLLRAELAHKCQHKPKARGRWKKLWRRYVRSLQRNR